MLPYPASWFGKTENKRDPDKKFDFTKYNPNMIILIAAYNLASN